MNLKSGDKYISLPLSEYERMKYIVDLKKDIRVNFKLSYYTDNFLGLERTLFVCKDVFEMNKQIDIEKLDMVSKMIEEACNLIVEEKNKEILYISNQLEEFKKIKSKWWFKMFNR